MSDQLPGQQHSLSYASENLPPAMRAAALERILAQIPLAMSISAQMDQPFQATLKVRQLHDLAILNLDANAHRGFFNRDQASTLLTARCLLLIPLSGNIEISLARRELVIGERDMALIDLTADFAYEFAEQGELLGLLMPRHMLIERIPQLSHVTGLPLPRNHVLQPLLSNFLGKLFETLGNVDLRQPMSLRLAGHAMDLLGILLADQLENRPAVSPYRASLLRRIKDFIELELHEPTFGVQAVAAKYRITTRYIAMLFQEDGTTFSDFLRQRRLEQCRRQLERPDEERRQIGEIALGAGFTSQAHFSRLFRATYQKTPRQYRSAFERHPDPPPARSAAAKSESEAV
ncbi:helix-turn-helix domain-containing protein [Dongia sp.]|uniref:helix-turn-helix domain-containing protein n=1 Tax=Dongia sp. TaxID=1977262 RepID=UPI0035AFD213